MNNDAPEMVEIPVAELKTLRALAEGLTTQNNLVLSSQKDNYEIMKALLIELAKQETLVIPAPEVTVKAAIVKMPDIPAPVVTVMEAAESPRKIIVMVERDGRGLINRLTGTIE